MRRETTQELSWPRPPETVRLESGEIPVWCASLGDFNSELPQFRAMLSSAEQAKAARFRFSRDRNSYVIRHGILRVILGRYLAQPPSEIELCYGPFGKPEIKGEVVGESLHFNHSHSGDLALFAVARGSPIGIDVEYLRPLPHLEAIAARFFSPREAEMLTALRTECRMEQFFACWTRKEAILKATGEGIGEGLANVEVAFTAREEAEIPRIAGESQGRTEWELRSFSPAPGYLAAVAFKHHNMTLRQWRVDALFD